MIKYNFVLSLDSMDNALKNSNKWLNFIHIKDLLLSKYPKLETKHVNTLSEDFLETYLDIKKVNISIDNKSTYFLTESIYYEN